MYAAWEAGVWKALAPHVRPDLVVGASAGALNGWGIACGITPEELVDRWLDSALASIRVFHPEPLYQRVREMTPGVRPQIPFGLTIVEERRLRVRLVRENEITWQHLAATCAVPFFFPPVTIDGCRYVDGGLMGALPVWAAEEMGATRAIALNCLNSFPFRMLRTVIRPRQPGAAFPVVTIEPSQRLGSLRSAMVWSKPTVERWIELGERDGKAALDRLDWAP